MTIFTNFLRDESGAVTIDWVALTAGILLACLLGIYSRPLGSMAAFWPANAILLGLLLRHPELARHPGSWLCALLAYIAADLLTGATPFMALTLNLANLIGVLAGWLLLARVRNQVLGFQNQRSVMTVFLGCLLAATVSTLAGAWPSAVAFHMPLWQSALLWLSAEFYNYVLILPVFLLVVALIVDSSMIIFRQGQAYRIVQDANRNFSIGRFTSEEETSAFVASALGAIAPGATAESQDLGGIVLTTATMPISGMQISGLLAAFDGSSVSVTASHVLER